MPHQIDMFNELEDTKLDDADSAEDEKETITYERRKGKRKPLSAPILGKFKKWIDELRSKITPKSVAGKAVHYAFNEWKYLSVYITNGNFNISNVWVENAIRPFCIGKKKLAF
ncbi:MAG: hypothetical protein A2381_14705 [Bdellovibrionales bacterium RIFOXYB1_FULL_37_110]|nr:MAG: hypothetical protein A2417_05190 [Bdellovibrionales bacterium RIFOXYC1_FULL_37_79]OFZ57485.1 MAG: hypothetical protein A2381_14705 [Bdellovibrionales bacterium RIFOXYB1_FULL_37_110]OFZ62717.1 MAG: hypothetical protein A2577_17025 [Bdellovibrionales bacterium RIFOXYD1_FULL_36_51]